MKHIPLKDADFSLVYNDSEGRPCCKLHGAMNRLTPNGIYRCVATYKVLDFKTDSIKENGCIAGCQEVFLCPKCSTVQSMGKIKTGPQSKDWSFWCPNCKDRINKEIIL